MMEMNCGGSSLRRASTEEERTIAACKSHSEAERRRRQRINAHLATLRTMLPTTTKSDKASLLADVVRHVKELKRHAAVVISSVKEKSQNNAIPPLLPSETDEVTMQTDPGSSLIRATVSCEDRPDLLTDQNAALRSIRARAVRAEIGTLGGRIKSVFLIEAKDADSGSVRRALRSVVENGGAASSDVRGGAVAASGGTLPGFKRQRFSRNFVINDFQ